MPNSQTYEDFRRLVNMSRDELADWLETRESKSVGWISSGRKTAGDREESIGHESGRIIVAILGKNEGELIGADWIQIRRVNGYIKRHLGQGPTKQDVTTSRWRYSLMNWGHDPLKDL